MVLVGVKAWQVPEAAEAMRPLIGPETFVLPLQNGLEAPAQLSEILGDQHVLGGLCGLFCYVARPGHIVHAGTDPFIKFGELDNHRSQRVELLLETFKRAGVNAEIPPDIQVAMWMKFMFVENLDEVLALAFDKKGKKSTRGAKGGKKDKLPRAASSNDTAA